MSSTNFSLLEKIDTDLYHFAMSAEKYVYTDAQSALVKLRCFAEKMVNVLHNQLHISFEPNVNLLERMKHPTFVEHTPIEIRQKLHLLRMKGNKAAHGAEIQLEQYEILDLIRETYLLGKWLYLQKNPQENYPEYTLALNNNHSASNLKQEILSLQTELTQLNEKEKLMYAENSRLKEKLSEIEVQLAREKTAYQYKRTIDAIDLEQNRTLQYLKLQDCYNEYQLTQGQTELVERLASFMNDRTQNIFLLRGYAGTGKTFITKGLADYLSLTQRNYKLAAPTGKASKVLATKTGQDARTIHSHIYNFGDLVEYRDENNPDTYKFYTNLKTNEDASNTVYIVDEASMISDCYSDGEFIRFGSGYLLKDLLKYINIDQNDHQKKVIFIGDNAQLPPVGMNNSPALDPNYLFNKYNLIINEFELTDVVRQKAESGVIKNALKIRDSLKKNEFNQLHFDLSTVDIQEIQEKDCVQCYLNTCNYKINGESIVVAYSNADVQSYNKAIRQYFFPNQDIICTGDKVMSLRNMQIDNLKVYNGDFGLIRKVSPQNEERVITLRKRLKSGEVEKTKVTLSFRDVEIGFRNENEQAIFVEKKIIENLLYSDNAQLSSDEQKALYIDFCIRHPDLSYSKNREEFKNALLGDPYFNALPIKFGYAITCHKAQGSEWNNVIVKCDTHQNKLSKGYFRWIYTAITRTANNLYLINPPKMKLGGGLKVVGVNTLPDNMIEKTKDIIDAPIKQQSLHSFDSSNLSGISNVMAERIGEILSTFNCVITNIETSQYHDIYTVQYQDKKERFKAFYNSKNKLTRIMPINMQNQDLLIKLQTLENAQLNLTTENIATKEFKFNQDFLNEFHHIITDITGNNGLSIQSVDEMQWNVRYQFAKENQIAVLDIYFDSKHKFTKINPIISKSTSDKFVFDIVNLIMKGLS
ncbi:AAA family ATPase [[Haemophilus] felis]|nr:AAA family ATPase [[Haemophilus] felis]